MLARWAIRLAACLAVAVVSSCSTFFWMMDRLYTPVPLTTGLSVSGKLQDINDEFDRRVQASFPIGSSVIHMGTVLRDQGFLSQDWGWPPEQPHVAMRREDGIPCRQAAYVSWRIDAEGRLTSIKGNYQVEGCL